MAKFSIQTLGCKVNQYESEQMASLLRSHGWTESDPDAAELRIVNTCSVTAEAASKSRQAVRRAVRTGAKSKVVVAGCWATSDKQTAGQMTGVDLVLTHHDNVSDRLTEFVAEGAKNRLGLVLKSAAQRAQKEITLSADKLAIGSSSRIASSSN